MVRVRASVRRALKLVVASGLNYYHADTFDLNPLLWQDSAQLPYWLEHQPVLERLSMWSVWLWFLLQRCLLFKQSVVGQQTMRHLRELD